VKLLQDQGVVTRSRGLTPVEIEQVVELYRSGLSIAKVSQKLGRAQSTIWRTLLKAGVEMRPREG
jgi:IS30 family transposase